MKLLTHLLAGIVGAAVAGYTLHHLHENLWPAPPPAPLIIRVPAPTSPMINTPAQTEQLKRLAAEKADLSAQLKETRQQLIKQETTLSTTRADLTELRRPMSIDMSSSTLSAQLKSGESVVTGGYQLPDGKRVYAFVQPTVQLVNGENLVRIESRLRAITDEAGSNVGLDNLATNAANTIQHGEVWLADEQAVVLSLLDESAGTDALSYPSLTLRSGASGMLELDGLTLKVTPILGTDQQTLDLQVRLEQQSTPTQN